jgi:hypothetical protein
MFIVNNIILNLSIENRFYINNLIMKTYVYLVFENKALIVNNELLNFKNMDWLVDCIVKKLKNSHWISLQSINSD